MQSLALLINSNTNQFVDLKCKSFRKLLVCNGDTEDITIHLVVGKDDNAGQTSITNGAFIYRHVKIPQGVTLHIDGFDFGGLATTSEVANALREDDYTLLIAAGDTNKIYSLFIEY
jgi:hypothetical protein